MKISILTPSYNQGKYIRRCIESVANQGVKNFEHIIMDGGSTDNTGQVVKEYPHVIFRSEKDKGQSDALNKGLKASSGDVIGWINSDDYYVQNSFAKVLDNFGDPNIKWLIGNVVYEYSNLPGQEYVISPTITKNTLLKNPDIVKQQGTFFRKSIIERAGGWDDMLHMAMDYDLWLRLSSISVPKMLNEYLAYFTHHEDQKTNPINLLKQTNELKFLMKREGAEGFDIAKMIIKKRIYYYKKLLKNILPNC